MPYDIPTWLQGTPDEPAKIFMQATSAGSQIGANIGANLRAMGALREEQRQFDARRILIDQQAQLNQIKIANAIRENQDQIQSESAFTKVADLYSRHQALGIAGTDGSEAAIGYTIANNPNFYLHPGAKDLLANMFTARKTRDVAAQREADAQANLERVQTQQEAALARTEAVVQGRETVAQMRSAAQVEAASIKAEASARSLLNTKEFQTFMARKQAIVSDVTLDLDKKFEAIKNLEAQYNVVQKSDEGQATGKVPVTRAGPEIRSDVVAPNDLVPVIAPDGRKGKIPRSQLESALQNGYTQP